MKKLIRLMRSPITSKSQDLSLLPKVPYAFAVLFFGGGMLCIIHKDFSDDVQFLVAVLLVLILTSQCYLGGVLLEVAAHLEKVLPEQR